MDVTIRSTGVLDFCVSPNRFVEIVRPYYFPSGIKAKPGMPSYSDVSTVRAHYATQPVRVPAAEIVTGDYLVVHPTALDSQPVPAEWLYASHPNAHKVSVIDPNSDNAWMLGLFAADGGTQGTNAIGFTLAPKDDVDRLVAVWGRLGLTARVEQHPNYFRVIVNSRTVSESFRQWFGKSDAKQFPPFVHSHGFDIHSLLEGYVAGDGYVEEDGTITCQTISHLLAHQVFAAALATGLSPTMSPVRRHSGYANAKPSWKIQWREAATQRHTTWWRGMYLMPVTAVWK